MLKRTAHFVLLLAFLGAGWVARAGEQPLPEHQLKALFIYNFAKFIDWPAEAFADTNSPIVVGVLGTDSIGDNLDQTIHDQPLEGRRFMIKRFATAAEALTNRCHILYVCTSEAKRLPETLKMFQDQSTLTVSEIPGFAKQGGVVEFINVRNKVRFAINNGAARAARLRLSSQLLNLATDIYSDVPRKEEST